MQGSNTMHRKRVPGQCSCTGHYTDKWHRWVVLLRGDTSSKLYCLDCRAEWRSNAKYIVLLPDHQKRVRSGLTDEAILDAILHRGLFTVDLEQPAVYSASGQALSVVSRTHPEGPQRGTYRFVVLCVDGKQKKVALHRLVWMVANGRVTPPDCDVDHINSQEDDSINNLRLLTSTRNRGRRKDQESDIPF
jgi:hypothetical protein